MFPLLYYLLYIHWQLELLEAAKFMNLQFNAVTLFNLKYRKKFN